MAQLEVEIVNKVTNLSALTEEKAALSGAVGGGFTPLGGGTVNFGGSLTRDEQAVAASQLALVERTKASGAAAKEAEAGFKGYENQLKQAVIVSGEAGSITDGMARKMAALGSLGITPMSAAMIGTVVGIGVLVEAGKSWIDNSEKQQQSLNDLKQAYAAYGQAVPNKEIQTFIDKNTASISSMYEVEEGFATLTRSGLSQTEVQKDMNRAVDLAAIKNISLTSAVDLLIADEGGHTKGLIDLGITTTKYTDAQGNVINQGKNMALVMAEIDAKTRNGRQSLDESKQASDRLSIAWQKLSNQDGPGLVSMIDWVKNSAADMINEFLAFGSNDTWWANLDKGLTTIAADLRPIVEAMQWMNANVPGWQYLSPGTMALGNGSYTASNSASSARGFGDYSTT